MPDKLDYEWLAEALRRPEHWTQQDHDVIAFLLAQAHDDLVATPPHYRGYVERRQRSIAELEAAMNRYKNSRS